MKQLKSLAILLALTFMLSFALPAFAQDAEPEVTEEPMAGDTLILVGTIEFADDDEDGDIVFTTEDSEQYIIAPAGSFNPSFVMVFEEGTLFQLEGILLNLGGDDAPATVQSLIFDVYDVLTDTDEDGIVDLLDNCIDIPNADQLDTDLDGIGDACDDFNLADDADNDGITDLEDNCVDVANADQLDTDLDGIGDVCDEYPETMDDMDNDGVTDAQDNCPEVANNDQSDVDGDLIGDACDEDFVEETEEEFTEGGFYCRNRDILHPAGGRIAEAYEVDYAELISQFCGDESGHKIGWGVIRRGLQAEANEERVNGNGNGNSNNNNNGNNSNGNGNGNSNGNGNGNSNGNGNGNSNGNGNGNSNGNGNGNGRGNGRGN